MKAMRLFRELFKGFLSVGLLGVAFSPANVLSQSILTNFPTVTIKATDPLASWTGKTGTFTLYRGGDPIPALNVYVNIAGTASNGVHYQNISSFVQIPSGVVSTDVVIRPINLGQTNTKTVSLTLGPSPLMMPGIAVNYRIGIPSNAVVFIVPAGVTDIPPTATIVYPTNDSVFNSPANINLIADASDPDGVVTSVEFFAGTNEIGVTSNWAAVDPVPLQPPPPPGTRAFMLQWTNVPGGIYSVTAVATDNGGVTSVPSPAVEIIVKPVTNINIPPVVRITSPPNHAIFRAPVTLPLFAYAFDPDGSVASVEFFDGSNALGFGNRIIPVPIATPLAGAAQMYSTPVSPGPIPLPPIPIPPPNRYVFVWTNVPVGAHVLTAVATDNGGASTTSDPVNILVLPGFPPPTNLDIVDIVATDPIAIEGTNSWPWLGLGGTPTWSNWTSPTPLWCIFTNRSPKDAAFTVRRFGDISSDVTVSYGIGGTASNGVEYVTLPGVVTIPAGECSTRITVVPIDDGPPDITSTVVLTLTRDTNMPPDYVLGFRDKAAAIILDGPPWPVTTMLPNKCFHMQTPGPDGAWFHIESSPDAVNWMPICTNQVICGSIDFVDPNAVNSGSGFYRAVPELNPPAQ